jgi:hypothetical protein
MWRRGETHGRVVTSDWDALRGEPDFGSESAETCVSQAVLGNGVIGGEWDHKEGGRGCLSARADYAYPQLPKID